MSVKLHKVTLFVVDDGSDDNAMAKLWGDCYHNWGAHVVETQTAEFDRKWSDDDPLNRTATLKDRALLESLVAGQPVKDLTFWMV